MKVWKRERKLVRRFAFRWAQKYSGFFRGVNTY